MDQVHSSCAPALKTIENVVSTGDSVRKDIEELPQQTESSDDLGSEDSNCDDTDSEFSYEPLPAISPKRFWTPKYLIPRSGSHRSKGTTSVNDEFPWDVYIYALDPDKLPIPAYFRTLQNLDENKPTSRSTNDSENECDNGFDNDSDHDLDSNANSDSDSNISSCPTKVYNSQEEILTSPDLSPDPRTSPIPKWICPAVENIEKNKTVYQFPYDTPSQGQAALPLPRFFMSKIIEFESQKLLSNLRVHDSQMPNKWRYFTAEEIEENMEIGRSLIRNRFLYQKQRCE
jgi:hypothetical protein